MTISFLFRFWVVMIAGWIHEQQQGVIAYKDEEIHSLQEAAAPKFQSECIRGRFVRSIKQECLDNFIFMSEKQLRYVINEYVEHYNRERPHQGIGNIPITPPPEVTPPSEERSESPVLSIRTEAVNLRKVQCRERLGGMLKHYYRKAA